MSSSVKTTCFYKCVTSLEQMQSSHALVTSYARSLFSDKDLTNLIGYTSYTGNVLPWSTTNYIVDSTALFLIDTKIFKCGYVKKDNETISTPISYYNNASDQSFIGTITREILEDGLTRKVTIEYYQ